MMIDSQKLRFVYDGPTTALTITGIDMISGQTISETIDVPVTNDVHYSGHQYSRIGTEAQDKADDDKADLTAWITSLFDSIKGRDVSSYSLTGTEQSALAQRLVYANVAAHNAAYQRAMAVAGLSPTTEAGILSTFKDMLRWARDQVASIIKTMAEQFAAFLEHLAPDADVTSEADAWLDRYVAWKAEQIANATIGTGANEGSMEAIKELLEQAVEGIRVRVVPGESSSDVCSTYAGKDYGVEEYLNLDIRFPVHPECIHRIEVYREAGAA